MMGKRVGSLFLALYLVLQILLSTMIPVFADGSGNNEYGHKVTYSPVRYLYTTVAHPDYVRGSTKPEDSSYVSRQPLSLFDANISQWASVAKAIGKDKAKAKSWLFGNYYLLNKFGYRSDNTTLTSSKIIKKSETKIFPGNLSVGFKEGSFYATYHFEGLSWQDSKAWNNTTSSYKKAIEDMNNPKTGNIGNMLAKGDIKYFLAFELDGYNHSCIFCSSYDTSILKVFGNQYNKQSFQAYNYTNEGPNFSDEKAWFPAKTLNTLYYSGDSGHDEKISAKLTNAILVGKDIAGPRIKSIKLTSDKVGENEIPGGAVTLDNIGNLTDRTVYFQVIWDEPVKFENLDINQISDIALKVQTLGQDGTSGMVVEAPFLSFNPLSSDSTPQMTFEYRLLDPYTDNSTVAQERGYFYKFNKVVVSNRENTEFWNNIKDLSGNKFAANSNGNQPAGSVECALENSPFVDLKPFGIENIRITKDLAPKNEFVEPGELLSVTLELNKNLGYSTIGTNINSNYFYNGMNYENLPTVVLNIKDPSGQYVSITPESPLNSSSSLVKKVFNGTNWEDSNPKQQWITPVKNQAGRYWPLATVSINEYTKASESLGKIYYDANKITYNVQLYPGYTIDGDTIKVKEIIPSNGTKDNSGYTLMNYSLNPSGQLEPINLPDIVRTAGKASQYIKSPDKQYKLDFTPPAINVEISDENDGIIKIVADIDDANLWGCDAAFNISVEGSVKGNIQYQPSSNDSYDDGSWKEASLDSTTVAFSSPIIGNKAYGFIKLPDIAEVSKAEVSKVKATVTVTDEARNSATGVGELPSTTPWSGFDNLPPIVELVKVGEEAQIIIKDMSDVSYSYEWQDTFDTEGNRNSKPSSFTGNGTGKEDTISYPVETLPVGNMVHKKTLWVQAEDAKNNKSEVISMDFDFNRTYSEIKINSTNPGRLMPGEVPTANITLKNVSRYWYIWIEKPTDYIYRGDTDIDYGDAASYVAGEGWGLFGAKFNSWQPNDVNIKVERIVENKNSGGASGISLLNTDLDPDKADEKVDGEDIEPEELNNDNELDGAVIEEDKANEEDEGEKTVTDAVYGAYENETTFDILLDYNNTQVVRYDDESKNDSTKKNDKWMLRSDPNQGHNLIPQTKNASESTRPLILLIAVEDPSDNTEIGATPGKLRFVPIEFDTFYNEPELSVRQMRLSTNNINGNRLDHERKSDEGWVPVNEGLYWPMDKFTKVDNSGNRPQQSQLMINTTTLNDFGEAEFYLGADPATGLDRLPNNGVKVELRKELYRAKFKEEKEEGYTNKLVFDYDLYIEVEKEPQLIQSWDIGKDDLTKVQLFTDGSINDTRGSQRDFPYGTTAYRFNINLDPSRINAVPYEIHFVDNDEGNPEPEVWYVRYGFYAVYNHEGLEESEEFVSQFIFDNTAPSARLGGITEDVEGIDDPFMINPLRIGDLPMGAQAIFSAEGTDITANIPLVTYSDWDRKGEKSKPGLYFELYDSGIDLGGAMPSYPSPYMPLILSVRDNENTKLGSQPVVRYGTKEDLELNDNKIQFIESAGSKEFSMEEDFLSNSSDFVSPLKEPSGIELNEFDGEYIYYQFYDKIRGTESPIYVIDLRRDDTPPVLELSVSETENLVREVDIKIDGLYDLHPVTSGDMTTYVIDTPQGEIKFEVEAWREVGEGEEFNTTDDTKDDYYDPEDFQDIYDDDGNIVGQRVRVKPNSNGIYNFVRNGYIHLVATDAAGNDTMDLIVNGKKANTADVEWGIRYEIKNIDLDPPKFITEPNWTINEAEGKITLTAKTDNTASAAYIRFDKDYTEFLTGKEYEEEIPRFALGEVPGQFGFNFDTESGELNLTAYVKYGEGKALKNASLIVVDSAGNEVERNYDFGTGLSGIEPKIINAKTGNPNNKNDYPIYSYRDKKLSFNIPVKIDMYNTEFALDHEKLPIYSDGPIALGYIDLFGGTYVEYIYADIFGSGFNHSVKLYVDDKEIDTSPTINKNYTNKDITIKIDTSITSGLTIDGKNTKDIVVSENGEVSYTLKNNSLNQENQEKTFKIFIDSIDKEAPEAYVNMTMNSYTDEETGGTKVYSMTYEITGFNKRNVKVIDNEGNSAPLSVTFDKSSTNKTYTFKFKDMAGNVGIYPINVDNIEFSDPEDAKIAGYRLIFSGSGKNGTNTLGKYLNGEAIDLGSVNSDVLVKAEALNANGEIVPSTMSLLTAIPDGATAFLGQKSILFTLEKEIEQNVSVKLTGLNISGQNNTIEIPIKIPGGTIDKTPPKGTVNYVESEGIIKVYLIPSSSDLAVDGISVIGQKGNGIALELKKDVQGYYVEFDTNGSGHFILKDKAGNIGTIAIAVASIDSKSPELGSEGWSGIIEAYSKSETWGADLQRILSTPTNNSIKLFFYFNEQLSKALVEAYDKKEGNKLSTSEDYVTAIVSGNTVTIEFKQNCQARIAVYDIRGNETVLWRPEDGSITIIDKNAPNIVGSPIESFTDNKLNINYKFDEDVKLLTNSNEVYKTEHEIEFDKNGQYILTFADRAGNVISIYPTVDGIDELAPHIKMSMDFVGEGKEAKGKDDKGNAYYYTNKNIRILLNVADDTPDNLEVTASKQSGVQVEVNKENITANEKPYTHNLIISENGVYTITAKDKWNQENTVYASITLIDNIAPSIVMESTKAVTVEKNADKDSIKKAVLQGVRAIDGQSGMDTDGLTVDVSEVVLSTPGSYDAKIKAIDRIGNKNEKIRTVNILGGGLRVFKINDELIEANDIYTTTDNKIIVDTSHESFRGEKINLYYSEGYHTMAQMKYKTPFIGSEGFSITNKGYYTVLAQSRERGMYLLYIYVY